MSLSQDEGHSFVSIDDLEPRLPPRLSRYPAPFDFPEKPVFQVPDISLIFDSDIIPDNSSLPGNTPKQNANSSQTSLGRVTPSSQNSSGMVETTSPAGVINSRSSEPTLRNNLLNSSGQGISSMDKINSAQSIGADYNVFKELQSQRETITRMEEKLDKIMQFQDGFLSQIFRRGALISTQVQTDDVSNKKLTRRSQPKRTTTTTSDNDSPILTPKHQHRHPNNQNKQKNGRQFERILTQERVQNNNSLSPMQLPSFNAPSDLLSAASGIKSLQLQDFEDDSSHSGSGELFGSDASSSDEDENPVKPVIKVKPPGQNVSPNGNLMFSDPSRQASPGAKLWTPPPQPSPHPFENNTERTRNPCSNENNRISSGRHHNQHRYKSTPRTGSNFHSPAQKYPNSNELRGFDAIQTNATTGPTETTVYGMTPSNLSFATKEYLHRYGLVTQQQSPRHQSPTPNEAPRQSRPPHKNFAKRYEEDRILNITEIKNQPKFL
ncbi:uncharacterized protein LOC110849718 [Folsomia candida]|uniref:SCL-interrupting locus protein n=1 Tax=Folsomia candida TaxID=158441 RepID=A0A226E945_FOLCA|nr:uncharacterized protein LOC110849718 [Folsomia candida]OXA54083.1 SCL-interrupting locus protein [Folsomia candida]